MEYTNRILDASERLFRTCMSVAAGEMDDIAHDELRNRVMKDIEHADRLMFDAGYPSRITGMARYALVAYADESMMKSSWPERLKWMSSPLQLEMFGEHVAGRKFFEQVASLSMDEPEEADLIELHYVCIELGYEGSYRIEGPERLQALKVDMQSRIERFREKCKGNLPPERGTGSATLAGERFSKPLWVVSSAALLVIILVHAGLDRNLDSRIRSLADSMERVMARIQDVARTGERGI